MRAWIFALLALFVCAPLAAAQEDETYEVTPELIARAEAGDLDAMDDLAMAYIVSGGSPDEALRWTQRSAEAGRPEAMGNLASMLSTVGRRDEAAEWQRRALEAGSNVARLNEAYLLTHTPGLSDADWQRAMQYLRDINNPRTALAIDDVALRYQNLRHATAPRARALTQLAAERGAPAAQWRYAMMLREGVGGPQDVPLAYTWARRSGEGGDVNGIISTAVMLATGEGVELNSVEAARWYQRAIDQHQSAHALRGLGGMYLSGELPSDPARGWAYLELAASAGDQLAPRLMQHYADQATPQVRTAARLIRESWVLQYGQPR